MKKAARIVASLILAGAMSAVAMADNDMEFKGYARSGALYNTQLGSVGSVDLNNIGRLGNENDSPYMEAELVKNFKAGKSTGKYHIMLAHGNGGKGTWTEAVAVRQCFVEMTGLSIAPTATVWAGKRFYGRDDVHITDKYWRNMSGTGAGVTGLLGNTLDLAMVNGGNPGIGLKDKSGDVSNVTFDARYKLPKMGPGVLELEGALTLLNGADDTKAGNGDESASNGIQGAAIYGMSSFFNVGSGFSKVALQYGMNAAAGNVGDTEWGIKAKDDIGTDNSGKMNVSYDGASMLRFSAFGVTDLGKWQVMPAFYYEYKAVDCDITNANLVDNKSVISATIRPEYVVSDNFVLAFEAGYALIENNNFVKKADGGEYKLTVAPTLKLDSTGFWNRPELRAFVSYVGKDKDLGGIYTNDKGTAETSEMRIGTQAEVWF